jgi:hypothetical protein
LYTSRVRGSLPIAVLTLLCALAPRTAPCQKASGELLYRMTLMRAAPGKLPELLNELRGAPGRVARPRLILRHAQGDQWDLMVLAGIGGYQDYFARPAFTPALATPELVAWQEDQFVRGPDLAALPDFWSGALYHVEMFLALPDKRVELLAEREKENMYLEAVGRPVNAIFVRELGASWDLFTIGAYRGWKHYAERDDVPPQRAAEAARAAGFAGDDQIGFYLRTLIHQHHDTLATPVR